jgi:adenine phosphoribosyltransferase
MQVDAIKPGQNVIVIDDLIATGTVPASFLRAPTGNPQLTHRFLGGSAKAAGELVKQLGGKTLEYLFIVELLFLNGSTKLDAGTYSIIQSND